MKFGVLTGLAREVFVTSTTIELVAIALEVAGPLCGHAVSIGVLAFFSVVRLLADAAI
jgi:hypothetical protein